MEAINFTIQQPMALNKLNGTTHWTFLIANGIMKYVLPLIIITGLIGNTVSILVFLNRELRRLSSSIYVLAVLMSDMGLLVGLLFVWLEVLGIRLNHREGACQFLVFLTYACSFLSVWYTVGITLENYIAICHPTKVKTLCSRLRATIVVTVLACATLPLYVISTAATEVRVDPTSGAPVCKEKKEKYVNAMHVLTYFDSFITLLVPLVCVTAMLVAITMSIVHTYKWRRSSPGSQKRRAELMQIPQVRVAKMLFALSLVFVVMNTPSHVSRLYYLISSLGRVATGSGDPSHSTDYSIEDNGGAVLGGFGRNNTSRLVEHRAHDVISITNEEGLLQMVFQYGSYSYYAIKFIIFLTFSKNFRRTLRDTCTEGLTVSCSKRPTAPTLL